MQVATTSRSAIDPRRLAATTRDPVLVPAVSRAIAVLERLADRREPMSLARIAAELSLPKSSVHGLCTTLVSLGYLRRQSDGAFLIGPGVMSLAAAFVSGIDVAREFDAIWAEVGTAPDETVVLSMLTGGEALYVAVRNSARPLGLAFHVGMRLPAYLSGSGKAMLAWLDAADVDRRLSTGGMQTRLTSRGVRSVQALHRELQLTRRRGWSVDDGAVREGVHSFGAPVFGSAGEVVAALSVCINKAQLGADRGARFRDEAIELARTLTTRIGGRQPIVPAAASGLRSGR